MALRSSRRFTNDTKPSPAPTTRTRTRGSDTDPATRTRRTRTRQQVGERASGTSVRRDPNRVVLSPDGEIGRVGSGWWAERGKRLHVVANRRDPDNAVLAVCKLAAAQFDGWNTEPLPPGAQRVYDQIARYIGGEDDTPKATVDTPEATSADSDAVAEKEASRPSRRRGRRARRIPAEDVTVEPAQDDAETSEDAVDANFTEHDTPAAPEVAEAQETSEDASDEPAALIADEDAPATETAQDDASATDEAGETSDEQAADETTAEAG